MEISGGAIQRLVSALVEVGLVEQQSFSNGQTKYAVLHLTDRGKAYAAELG